MALRASSTVSTPQLLPRSPCRRHERWRVRTNDPQKTARVLPPTCLPMIKCSHRRHRSATHIPTRRAPSHFCAVGVDRGRRSGALDRTPRRCQRHRDPACVAMACRRVIVLCGVCGRGAEANSKSPAVLRRLSESPGLGGFAEGGAANGDPGVPGPACIVRGGQQIRGPLAVSAFGTPT